MCFEIQKDSLVQYHHSLAGSVTCLHYHQLSSQVPQLPEVGGLENLTAVSSAPLSQCSRSGFSRTWVSDLSAFQQDRPRSEEEGRRRGGYIGTTAGMDNNPTLNLRTGKYFRQRAEDLNIWMNRKRRDNLRIGRNRASEGQVSALASWNGCGACVPTKATEEAQIFLSSATW